MIKYKTMSFANAEKALRDGAVLMPDQHPFARAVDTALDGLLHTRHGDTYRVSRRTQQALSAMTPETKNEYPLGYMQGRGAA